jgi:hypothetical protein
MILALGIIIFVIGCCLSSFEDVSYTSQVSAERRQKELLRELAKLHENEVAPRKAKRTQRRIAKDKEGNMMAEEIIEEIEQ